MTASMSSRATQWHPLGLTAVSAAVVCWSFGNILVRQVDLGAVQLAFWRLALSSLVYGGVVLARRGRVTWPQVRACLPSAVMLGLWYIAFYQSIKSTTVTNVSMIVSLVPVVLIWAAVRRFAEPVSLKLLALVATALAGTALVLFGSASVPTWSLRGDGLAVLALLCFSAQMALAKEARQKVGALEFQAVAWIVAMVVVTPPAVLTGGGLSLPDTTAWLWVAALVAVPGSGHLLMNWAHKTCADHRLVDGPSGCAPAHDGPRRHLPGRADQDRPGGRRGDRHRGIDRGDPPRPPDHRPLQHQHRLRTADGGASLLAWPPWPGCR